MNLLKTYVDGLDELLNGGIPEGCSVLIAGAPGTMKTSLAYYILYQNARHARRGLYVSLEQSRASLLDHANGLGLPFDTVQGELSVLDLAALRKSLPGGAEQPWLDLFKMYVKGLRSSFDYQFLVLDSLDALEILAKYTNPRKEFFDLISWIRGLGCTTFVLGEVSPAVTPSGRLGRTTLAKHKEEYLVDGILHVRLARQGDFGMQRQLRVVKMRGVRHNPDYHALVFDNGFRVTSLMG